MRHIDNPDKFMHVKGILDAQIEFAGFVVVVPFTLQPICPQFSPIHPNSRSIVLIKCLGVNAQSWDWSPVIKGRFTKL